VIAKNNPLAHAGEGILIGIAPGYGHIDSAIGGG